MAKVQNLSELSQSFSFTEYDFFDFYRRSFERSELGRIKKLLPLREMAEDFGLVSGRRAPKRGRTSSVSVPLTIVSELQGKLDGNKQVLLSAFGVGMTWATGIVPFVDCKISDIVEVENGQAV